MLMINNIFPTAGSTINGFLSSPEMNSIRRPAKLEALPREATTKALKALKINSSSGDF